MFGIPNLLNKAPRAIAITLLGNLVGQIYDFFVQDPPWGVYKAGTTEKAVDVTSVSELDTTGTSLVSDYPIETGSFVSYNKVQVPNFFSIRLMHDGFLGVRGSLLEWLEANVGNLETFDIICPEKVWSNVTLVRYRVSRRAEAGAGMIVADCDFQQVRERPAVYTNSKVTAPENKQSEPAVQVQPRPIEPTQVA